MIKSMTGYGRAVMEFGSKTITAEIRSVNQRYFDCTVKLPRIYSFLEEPIKKRLQSEISRGKLDVYIGFDLTEGESVAVSLNKPVLNAYLDAFREMENEFNIRNDISASKIAQLPDIFSIRKVEEDAEKLKEEVFNVLDEAITGFGIFRRFEGEKMYNDISERGTAIKVMKNTVEERSPECVKEYREKLETRIRDMIANVSVDENRLLTETAIFADKTAVAEETVRLQSHLDQLENLIKSDDPVGRKLDFLLQEMNREVNTIGSKVNNVELTDVVVNMKCELEKIREQIQNIE